MNNNSITPQSKARQKKKGAIASLILGGIGLAPFLGVIIISKFLWQFSLPSNFIMYSFYLGLIISVTGLILGVRNLKAAKKVATLGIILSTLGVTVSIYFISSSIYLSQF